MADQRTPSTFSDILESTSTAKFVDIISHGEINGLVTTNELESVFIDRNPIQVPNSNDVFNFEDVIVDFKEGINPQQYITGFSEVFRPIDASAAGLGGGFEITLGGPDSVGPTQDQTNQDYIYRASSLDVDAIQVTITIPRLIFIADDGDQFGNRTSLAIHAREAGSTFLPSAQVKSTNPSQGMITGKVLSPYSITYRIQRPEGLAANTLWEVICRKRIADDDFDTNQRENSILITGISEIIENREQYDDLAVAGVTIPAQGTNQSSVSNIEYDVEGMIVDVPDVYDADNRVMGTGWDGQTFKQAYTNCPAWCLLFLIHDELVGMGNPYSEIDVFSFVEFSQFCDERLEYIDTDGTLIDSFRFSCNLQFTDQQDPLTRIQQLAGTYRSYTLLNGGLITVVSDRRKDVSSIVTNSATVDGFNYSFTDVSQRTTLVRARFVDEELEYTERVIEESDDVGIQELGELSTEISIVGLTNEAEVRRHCRYILERTLRSTKLATWQTGFQAMTYQVGDRVQVIDNDFINLGGSPENPNHNPEVDEQSSGRVIAGSSPRRTNLDRVFDIGAGFNWKLGKIDENGDVLEAAVTAVSDIVVRGITVSRVAHGPYIRLRDNVTVDEPAIENHQWYMFTVAALPQNYEVVTITEDAQQFGMFTVVAKEYRDESFENIDIGVSLPSRPLTNYERANVPAPIFTTNITDDDTGFFAENVFNATTQTATNNLRLVWKPADNNQFINEYYLRWRVNQSEWNDETIKTTEFTINNAVAGFYDIRLVARSVAGVDSPPVLVNGFDFLNLAGSVSSLVEANSLRLKGSNVGTGDIDFFDANLTIEFNAPSDNDLNQLDPLQSYIVQYEATDGSGIIAEHAISPTSFRDQNGTRIFEDTLTAEENFASFQGFIAGTNTLRKSNGIQRFIFVRVFAVDIHGRRAGGVNAASFRLFTNDIPAGTTFDTFANSTSEIRITLNPSNETDIAGYFILKGDDPSVPFGNATQRRAAVQNGQLELIHADPAVRAFTSAEQDRDYIFYACPYDTMTADLDHYLSFGNWSISAVQQTPALTIDIEEFTNWTGDIRIDYLYSVANGFIAQGPFAGTNYNVAGTNHTMGVNHDQCSIVFNRADGDRILFEGFPNFPNHDLARSNLANNNVDDGDSFLYLYISIPTDVSINASRVLIDNGTNLYRYTGNEHRIRGATDLRDAVRQRQVILASYNRATDTFVVNEGQASVQGNRIIAQTIGTNQLIAGGIDADRIVTGSITAQQIATNAITANEIQALAVTASKLAVNSVSAEAIQAQAVNASRIETGTITSASGVIGDLSVNTLSLANNSVSTTFAAVNYHTHFYRWSQADINGNNGLYGSWIHRSSATDSTLAALIRGQVGGSGSTITASNLAGFQTLTVVLPSANTVGGPTTFDIVLDFSCSVGLRSRTNRDFHLGSNFVMEHDYIAFGTTRIAQSRTLPTVMQASYNCANLHIEQAYHTTLKYSIPTHPSPNLNQTVRFSIKSGEQSLGFFSPSSLGGGFRPDHEVIEYGYVRTPSMTATLMLK